MKTVRFNVGESSAGQRLDEFLAARLVRLSRMRIAGLCERVMTCLREHGVEFRRGTAGGGNKVRQPYLRRVVGPEAWRRYPRADHVHFFGFYIGNYPTLERERILRLCGLLNDLARHPV